MDFWCDAVKKSTAAANLTERTVIISSSDDWTHPSCKLSATQHSFPKRCTNASASINPGHDRKCGQSPSTSHSSRIDAATWPAQRRGRAHPDAEDGREAQRDERRHGGVLFSEVVISTRKAALAKMIPKFLHLDSPQTCLKADETAVFEDAQ
eukprot:1299494-Pleurochrysis_carterae.AAC.1